MLTTLGILSAAGATKIYATLDPVRKSPNVTVTGGNLTGTAIGNGVGIATIGKSTGKWYWETTVIQAPAGDYGKVGLTRILMTSPYSTPSSLGGGGTSAAGTIGYRGNTAPDGGIKAAYNYASSAVFVVGNAGLIVAGDVISTVLDCTLQKVFFYKNSNFVCEVALQAGSFVWYPAFEGRLAVPASSVTFNFGQNAWASITAALRASLLSSDYIIGLY